MRILSVNGALGFESIPISSRFVHLGLLRRQASTTTKADQLLLYGTTSQNNRHGDACVYVRL
jgi:hypothetical protein